MKKSIPVFFILASIIINNSVLYAQDIRVPDLPWAAKAGAKKIPSRSKEFKVTGWGARNDGTTVNTKAIQSAIDACASKGGGIVTFDSETSGSIRNILSYNLTANGTTNCINFKSAITRGGTVENIYVHDITMNNVGTMLRATTDWNPSYSYSSLPAGYSIES